MSHKDINFKFRELDREIEVTATIVVRESEMKRAREVNTLATWLGGKFSEEIGSKSTERGRRGVYEAFEELFGIGKPRG